MATYACIKAYMGTTEYYITKMTAGELINSVGIAKELPDWDDMTPDEKMQREYDLNRIVGDMVPYVVDDPDRFYGTLIVDVYDGYEQIKYETLQHALGVDPPDAYANPGKDMGFITLPGSERLIALDGQHRLLSLKIAIKGKEGVPYTEKPIQGINNLKAHPELAKDELSIIFVEHTDTQKIRKIFNKINKYAKQTSRSDNIITSDDDIYAKISRRLIKTGEPLGSVTCEGKEIELVNWKSNTLSTRSKNLTTISALYTMSETILKDNNYSTKMLPSDLAVEKAYAEISSFWTENLSKLDAFKEYLDLTYQNKPVSALREKNLLMKPVTQMALAHVALAAKRKNISWMKIIESLNQIDWSFDNPLWFNILVIGSTNKRMITGKEAIRSAGTIISYMVMGNIMTTAEIEEVQNIINNATGTIEGNAKLPAIINTGGF